MPILERETDLYPDHLLDRAEDLRSDNARWWAIYTLSRMEKQLMRRLARMEVPFYGPMIDQRKRSPSGRIRTSYIPLFSNYVFVLGDETCRYKALTTNCVSRVLDVADADGLLHDLRAIRRLVDTGALVTPEARLETGMVVRVRTGVFAGHEGTILRRHGGTRLMIALDFLQQGASVELEDCEVERIS